MQRIMDAAYHWFNESRMQRMIDTAYHGCSVSLMQRIMKPVFHGCSVPCVSTLYDHEGKHCTSWQHCTDWYNTIDVIYNVTCYHHHGVDPRKRGKLEGSPWLCLREQADWREADWEGHFKVMRSRLRWGVLQTNVDMLDMICSYKLTLATFSLCNTSTRYEDETTISSSVCNQVKSIRWLL